MINQDYIKNLVMAYLKKQGTWILIGVILFGIICNDIYKSSFFGMILYGFILLNRRTNIKADISRRESFDENTPKIIDQIIDESFNEYLVLNRGYKGADEHISSEEEKVMIDKMVDMVSERISDTIKEKLEAYYDRDSVPNIVSSKIYMAVMAYVITQNQPKDDLPVKKENQPIMRDISEYL